MSEPRHSRIVIAFAVIAVVLRLPAILYPVLGETEATEAVASAAVAGGGELYTEVVVDEPPLGPWLTAGLYRLFGPLANRSVHVFALLAVLLTMLALSYAARALRGRRASLMAPLFYGVFSIALPPAALGGSSQLWANLFAAGAIWFVLGGAPTRRYGAVFLGGIFAAAATHFRLGAAAVVAAVLGYLLIVRPLLLGRDKISAGAAAAAVFLGGFAVAFALPLAYLHSRGSLSALSRWLWAGTAGPSALEIAVTGAVVLGGALLPWSMALRDLRDTARGWRAGAQRDESAAATALTALWLVATIVAMVWRGRGAAEDFLALIAPLAMLGARGAAALEDDFWSGRFARVFRLGIAIPAAGFFGAGLFHQPLYRSLGLAPRRMLPIAERIRKASPGGMLWVLGPVRGSYVYTRRLPPPGSLDGSQLADVATLPAAIRRSPPAIIVDAGGARAAAVTHFLEERYRVEATVERTRILRRK